MTKKSFISGAAILGISGLICKIIGAFYRIPLANMIGTNGMAYYHVAYPIYTTLLVVSSAGLPSAISKMVSSHVALGDYRNAHNTFQVAFKILTIIGIILTLLLVVFSKTITSAMGIPEAYPSLLIIAPSLLLVSIISAYRGYFQGLQIMTPTAVSQLIEQIIKLAVGFSLALAWIKHGPLMGAVGALVGVTVSELVSLLALIFVFNRRKRSLKKMIRTSPRTKIDPQKTVIQKLITYAIPLTIGASLMPLVQLIDNMMVVNILQGVLNYHPEIAKAKFGLLTAYVSPIINMPAILSTALQISLVPAISSAVAAQDRGQVNRTFVTGIRVSLLLGLPCSVGLFILGGPVIALLYRNVAGNLSELTTTVEIMRASAVGFIFLTLSQTTSGILQGMGSVMIPVRNFAVGAVIKVIVTFILMRIPEINIIGAPIGTTVCYAVAAVLNIIYLKGKIKKPVGFVNISLRSMAATVVMGVFTYFSYMWISSRFSNTISTSVSILISIVIYVLFTFAFRSVRPEDMQFMPGGAKIDYILRRLKIWR